MKYPFSTQGVKMNVAAPTHRRAHSRDLPPTATLPPALPSPSIQPPAPDSGGLRPREDGPGEWRPGRGRPGGPGPRVDDVGSTGRSRSSRRPAGRLPITQASRVLLADAGRELTDALGAPGAAQRYAGAHLAALRAAAAVLAARARPTNGRRASAWDLLSRVAPEFGEWAAFFAAGSATRQAIQAGIPRLVSEREADDMVRQSEEFLGLARTALS